MLPQQVLQFPIDIQLKRIANAGTVNTVHHNAFADLAAKVVVTQTTPAPPTAKMRCKSYRCNVALRQSFSFEAKRPSS